METLANALQHNPALQNPMGWWMLSLFTASPLTCSPEGAQSTSPEGVRSTQSTSPECVRSTSGFKCRLQAAERIASEFLQFVGKHDLHETVLAMTPTQVQVVAVFHAQLKARPPRRVQLTERWEFIQQKQAYVPARKVESPATPRFAAVADAADGSQG